MSTLGVRRSAPAWLVLLLSVTTSAQPLPQRDGDQLRYKAEATLVLVPVVVRDSNGNIVGDLRREDFALFDNNEARPIASFSVEDTTGQPLADRGLSGSGGGRSLPPATIPDHFVVLLIDDLHLRNFDDMVYCRRAALKFLDTLQPTDRVAVILTAGPGSIDFTADRPKQRQTLLDMIPGGHAALTTMTPEETTRALVAQFEQVVERVTGLPGQRTIVLISPGLPIQGQSWTCVPETMRLIEHAIRSRVVIHGLDAPSLAIDSPNRAAGEFQERLTDGTAGTFVRDTNDLSGAVARLAATPRYVYYLGFLPGPLQPDGSFHKLTVKLRAGRNLDVKARGGYYAPGSAGLARTQKEPATGAQPDTPRRSEMETTEVARALGIASAPAPVAATPDDEVVTHDEAVTFKVQSTLVEVPVVARDRAGHAVRNLRQEDFRLFDNGKRQEITKFSVQETAAAPAGKQTAEPPGRPATPAGADVPRRYVAFVFDDLHIQFADLPQVREAVRRYLHSSLESADRAAVLTTSSKIAVDFTGDRDALERAVVQIVPNPTPPSAFRSCLYISYFQAVLIDQQVSLHPFMSDLARSIPLETAFYDAGQCIHLGGQALFDTMVEEVRQAYYNGEQESRATLAGLKDLVRRMSVLPGRRAIVFVSPGFFLARDQHNQESDLLALAIHSEVIVNTIDARGVWTTPVFDASHAQSAPPPDVIAFKDQEQNAAADELIALAEGTGGTENFNNDFKGAVRQAASAPECVYVLGFAPPNLKPDGSFHTLKVTVSSSAKLTLQARRGYWALEHAANEVSIAKQEIENAVFSRDEIHSLPVEMHTRVTETGAQAKLDVLTSVDLKSIRLRKAGDRNRNDLTLVAALFDGNGNFIAGTQKIVELRLRDETVQGLEQMPAVVIATGFDVKPGGYLVRLVVRDAEAQQITAENAAVQIP